MPDLFDQAQELDELWREHSIERARWHGARTTALECACGAQIPLERRQALPGVQSCVECARTTERLKGLKGG